MSTIVGDIIDAMETEISTALGSSYNKLKYVFDIEKNDLKHNANRYGVIPLEAPNADGVIRAVTLAQTFQVVLTDNYKNNSGNDLDQMATIKNLFDKMDDISKQLHLSKLGLPSAVLLVTYAGSDEPEYLIEHKVTALRGNFTVQYRTNL